MVDIGSAASLSNVLCSVAEPRLGAASIADVEESGQVGVGDKTALIAAKSDMERRFAGGAGVQDGIEVD